MLEYLCLKKNEADEFSSIHFFLPFFHHCFSPKVVNSPLFKTAVAGNDPNVGRLLSAVGKAMYRLVG